MSPAKDLGTRYTCWKCSTRFYDLKKPAPICPKCGADQRESPALREPPPKAAKKVAAPVPEDLEERDEVLEEEEESFDEEEDFDTVDEDAEDEDEL